MEFSNIEQVSAKEIEELLGIFFEEHPDQAVMITGASGIGKSEICQNIALSRGCKFIDFRLLTYTESDIKGIPFPDEGGDYTKLLPLDIFPRVDRDGERGVLILEEVTAAPRKVQSAAYQIVLDRKIGDQEIPPGWFIIATGNRVQDEGDFHQIAGPLANRFFHYELLDRGAEFISSWTNWAAKNKVAPEIVGFVTKFPQHLHNFDIDVFEEGQYAFPSPRQWTRLSKVVDSLKKIGRVTDSKGQPTPMMKNIVLSSVGREAGYSFLRFFEYRNEMVDPELILSGNTDYEMPENDSAIHMTMAGLLSLASTELTKEKLTAKGIGYLENITNFIVRIKAADFVAVSFMNLLMLNPQELTRAALQEIDNEALDDYITKNANILA